MNTCHRSQIVSCCLLTIAATACNALAQGSLTPPGAPAATMKTLQQVEPRTPLSSLSGDADFVYRITQSGSYYLTGDLYVFSTNGIKITASDVNLDLNGFNILRGFFTSGGNGIEIPVSGARCTIRNGNILGFQNGLYCPPTGGNYATGGHALNLNASFCSGAGLSVGQNWTVQGCTAQDNSGDGIKTQDGCLILNSTASDNGGAGINTLANCVLKSVTANKNAGFAGIWGGGACVIDACVANGNTGTSAISLGSFGVLTHSSATGNAVTTVINGGWACRIEGCVASANTGFTDVIKVNDNSTVLQTTVARNTTSLDPGIAYFCILAGENCTVRHCDISENRHTAGDDPRDENRGVGVRAGQNSLIEDNNIHTVNGNGVQVELRTVVQNNRITTERLASHSSENAAINVAAFSGIAHPDDCYIAGNRVAGGSDSGYSLWGVIEVDPAPAHAKGNFVVGNGGGNYWIGTNNFYGPLLNNGIPSNLGTTDPFANF